MSAVRVTFGSSSPAFRFVVTMGIVNLFGDITYEGGASINGPFMATLGASAAIVSITAGLGGFLVMRFGRLRGMLPTRAAGIGPSPSSATPST